MSVRIALLPQAQHGILSTLEALTGKVHYGPARLEGIEGVYASPVGAAGRVYVAGRNIWGLSGRLEVS